MYNPENECSPTDNPCKNFSVSVESPQELEIGYPATLTCQYTCGAVCGVLRWEYRDSMEWETLYSYFFDYPDASGPSDERVDVVRNGDKITLTLDPTEWSDDSEWRCWVMNLGCESDEGVASSGHISLKSR